MSSNTGSIVTKLVSSKWLELINSTRNLLYEKQNIPLASLEAAALSYASYIINNVALVQILSQTRPMSLESIFTNVRLLGTPFSERRFNESRIARDFQNRKQYQLKDVFSGVDLLVEEKKLYVVGRPGSGKTTFLRHLSYLCISKEAPFTKFPIFIQLRDYLRQGKDLRTLIKEQIEVHAWPSSNEFVQTLLESGQILLLLDGLDEVSDMDNKRSKIIQDIVLLHKEYPSNWFVITSRPAATDYLFRGFIYVEVAEFDKQQIYTFLEKWFQDSPRSREKFLKSLYHTKNIGLLELARTPLFLVMLCIAFQASGRFPDGKLEMFEEATTTLLRTWDASRGIKRSKIYHMMSARDKRQLFAQIAFISLKSEVYVFSSVQLLFWLEEYLAKLPHFDEFEGDAEELLRSLVSDYGLLVEQSKGYYSFWHLSIQEFFVASYLADTWDSEVIYFQLENYPTHDIWKEVFILLSNMLIQADSLLDIILTRIDTLLRKNKTLRDVIKNSQYWTLLMTGGEGNLWEVSVALKVFTRFLLNTESDQSLKSKISQLNSSARNLSRKLKSYRFDDTPIETHHRKLERTTLTSDPFEECYQTILLILRNIEILVHENYKPTEESNFSTIHKILFPDSRIDEISRERSNKTRRELAYNIKLLKKQAYDHQLQIALEQVGLWNLNPNIDQTKDLKLLIENLRSLLQTHPGFVGIRLKNDLLELLKQEHTLLVNLLALIDLYVLCLEAAKISNRRFYIEKILNI